MDNLFDDKEFEQLLQDAADEQIIYPSDSVWLNIQKEVRPPSSWPGLSIVCSLLLLATTIITIFNYPPDNIVPKTKYSANHLFANNKQRYTTLNTAEHEQVSFETQLSPTHITEKTLALIAEKNLVESQLTDSLNQTVTTATVVNTTEPNVNIQVNKGINENSVSTDEKLVTVTETASIAPINNTDSLKENNLTTVKSSELSNPSTYPDEPSALAITNSAASNEAIKLASTNQIKRWQIDYYFTPSISFRNIIDDKQRNQFVDPLTANATRSAANQLKHKPALGLEMGIGLQYRIDKKLSISTGLQFNSRQYFIDAYQNFNIATIAILQNNKLDSINLFSRYANSGSNYNIAKLDNKIYQISIPIGVQWHAIEGKKWGLNIGGSIQPTFTLNKEVYLLSTDYKYYVDGTPFFRKININTSLNLQLSYQLKHGKVYIGPQVRYQHLPTYNKYYPIKEFRWDYGLRVGIIKSF